MKSKNKKIILICLGVIIFLLLANKYVNFMEKKFARDSYLKSYSEDYSTEPTKYVNEEWGFSLEIPKGYAMNDNEGYFTIYSEPTEDIPTPLPEMTILIKEDNDMELEDRAPAIVRDVVINGVQGKRHLLSYSGEPEGPTTCLVYKLLHEGVSFEFKEWECLESPIFEEVVNSFKIISENNG